MRRHQLLVAGILLLLAAVLASCSASSELDDSTAGLQPAAGGPPAALDAVPSLSELLQDHGGDRYTSNTDPPFQPRTKSGDSVMRHSSNASLEETDSVCVLDSAEGISWAIYSFSAGSRNKADKDRDTGYLDLEIDQEAGQQLYVGVSNFEMLAWEWRSLSINESGPQQLKVPLDSETDYSSSDESLLGPEVFVALLTADGDTCRSEFLYYYPNQRDAQPGGLLASQEESSDSVELSWDAVPDASGYRIAVLHVPDMDVHSSEVEVQGGLTTAFVHNAETVPEVVPEQISQYLYQIWAVYPDGLESRLSEVYGSTSQ